MSLLPILINELLDDYRRPSMGNLYDQHFGLGILDNDAFHPGQTGLMPLRCGYIRPWRNIASADSGLSSIQDNKNEFKVTLDVQQFKPEEISVKVEGDFVVVDGKHEERSDQHGFIARQFTRRYKLPKDINVDQLKSSLSSDGVLSLNAPKKTAAIENSRPIPITHTNTPAVKDKTVKDK